MKLRITLLFLFLFSCAAVGAGPLPADDEITTLRRQVETLLKQVAEQNERIKALEARPGQPAEAATPAPSPPQGAAVVPQRPEPATALERYRGLMLGERVKLGGYGSMRFETANGGRPAGFTFRRFVLTTDAHLTERLRIYSETEFERLHGIEVEKAALREAGGTRFQQEVEGNAGGEIAIEQIWGQYNFHRDHGVRFGVVLPPLGRFNILHDDDYWEVPRRTLVDRDAPVAPVKVAWRELGLGLVGGAGVGSTGRLDYQFYVLGGSRLNFNLEHTVQTRTPRRNKLEVESEVGLQSGAFDGSDGAAAIAYRLAYSPSLAGEIAFSGYHGRYAPDFLAGRPWLNSAGLDGKWKFRNLEAEGEFLYTSFGGLSGLLNDFAAAVYRSSAETSSAEARELKTEIEVDLSGLARTRYGFWTDVKYHWRPAWMKKTALGRGFEDPQLIPIVRYERVWLNGHRSEITFANGFVTGQEREDLQQDRFTLGVSYRPVLQFSVQLAYEHNRRVRGSRLIFPAVNRGSTNGFLLGMAFAF